MKLPRIPKPPLSTLENWKSFLLAMGIQALAALFLILFYMESAP